MTGGSTLVTIYWITWISKVCDLADKVWKGEKS